jgi:hypothetical protein
MAMRAPTGTEDHPMHRTQVTEQEQEPSMTPTMAREVDPWSGA